VVEQGVELVISHHGTSGARIDHRARDLQRATNFWSPINKVADEDKLPGRMAVDAIALLVSQSSQQSLKLISMAMNVSDNVVFLVHYSPCGCRGASNVHALDSDGVDNPGGFHLFAFHKANVLLAGNTG
jgi:acid phosphatase class B